MKFGVAIRNTYVLGTLLLIVLAGCSSKTIDCDVTSLLLDEKFFPGKVDADPIHSPIGDDFPLDSATRYFYVGYLEPHVYSDGVQQDVIHLGSSRRASNYVQEAVEHVYPNGPWKPPEEALNLAIRADETYLACGFAYGYRTCRWLARYQSYYLYLRADISKKGMTEKLFVDAVKEVDQRTVQCLGE